jgi:hypothetical protein
MSELKLKQMLEISCPAGGRPLAERRGRQGVHVAGVCHRAPPLTPGWRLPQPKYRKIALAQASAEERVCAMRFHETILERLGKTFRGHNEDITHAPLPQRWVDLILYLDEQERKQSGARATRS